MEIAIVHPLYMREANGKQIFFLVIVTDVVALLNVVLKVLPWEMRRTSQGQCCRGAKQTTGGEWRERAKAPRMQEKKVESASVLASTGSI